MVSKNTILRTFVVLTGTFYKRSRARSVLRRSRSGSQVGEASRRRSGSRHPRCRTERRAFSSKRRVRRGTPPAESACCCLGLSKSEPERGSDRGVAGTGPRACPIRGVMASSGLGATALTDEGRLARLRASEERPCPEPVVSERVLQPELVGVSPCCARAAPSGVSISWVLSWARSCSPPPSAVLGAMGSRCWRDMAWYPWRTSLAAVSSAEAATSMDGAVAHAAKANAAPAHPVSGDWRPEPVCPPVSAPTLPLHVLPVHWSVPHSRPFALSLVLSLAHTHIHTRIETGGTHNPTAAT